MAWRPSVTTLLQTTNQQVIPTPPERREQLHYWHKHWADFNCATLGGKPDYLPLRWEKPPDAPRGRSIYWEPQSLDQSKTSISRRSSEQPESKIIRSFFYEPRYCILSEDYVRMNGSSIFTYLHYIKDNVDNPFHFGLLGCSWFDCKSGKTKQAWVSLVVIQRAETMEASSNFTWCLQNDINQKVLVHCSITLLNQISI